MRPTSDTAVYRSDLGQMMYEVMMEAPAFGYIGTLVMPVFFVAQQAANFPVMPKEALFNIMDTARKSDGTYNRFREKFESGFYSTIDHGLEYPMDDREAAIYASYFDYEKACSGLLLNAILLGREAAVAAKIFNASNFTPSAVTTEWNNVAATPIADVKDAKETLRAKGIIANALILSYKNFLCLKMVTEIVTKVTNVFSDPQKTGNVGIDHLKAIFEIENILVGGRLKNTVHRGQDATIADVWDDEYAMVGRVAMPGEDIRNPCLGRTITWNEGMAQELIVEQYYSDETRGTILRQRYDSDEVFLASYDSSGTVKSAVSKECGVLLSNIHT